jgi:hypothetical protein
VGATARDSVTIIISVGPEKQRKRRPGSALFFLIFTFGGFFFLSFSHLTTTTFNFYVFALKENHFSEKKRERHEQTKKTGGRHNEIGRDFLMPQVSLIFLEPYPNVQV